MRYKSISCVQVQIDESNFNLNPRVQIYFKREFYIYIYTKQTMSHLNQCYQRELISQPLTLSKERIPEGGLQNKKLDTTIATTMATTIFEELSILNLEENSLTYEFVGISQIDYFSYNVYKSLHTRSIYVSPRIETFKLI